MSGTRNSEDLEAGDTHGLLNNAADLQRIEPASPLNDIRNILFSGYINLLLIFLPFALLSGALERSPTVVFVTNFFALMPLASLLSFATEELSKTVGQGIGGLLNVTFGNATELIVGIIALRDGQIKLIQTTMLGSILSSLLFVIPTPFLWLTSRYSEPHL
jgi:Ca2+:H+ antiporter